MWNLVSVHLETLFVSVQGRCTVYANVLEVHKSFWTHPRVLLGDEAKVEARFGLYGDSVILDA
jgi:hypothetical protein